MPLPARPDCLYLTRGSANRQAASGFWWRLFLTSKTAIIVYPSRLSAIHAAWAGVFADVLSAQYSLMGLITRISQTGDRLQKNYRFGLSSVPPLVCSVRSTSIS